MQLCKIAICLDTADTALQAFRPGNVDLPAGSTTQSAAALVLPDAITELDLALPDPNLLLSDLDVAPKSTAHVSRRADITLAEDTLLQDSIEHGRDAPQEEGFEFGDDILQWQDLDLDIGEPTTAKQRHQRDDSEVEVGRDVEKSLVDDMFGESGLGPNAGFDDTITKMDGIDRDKTPTRARSEEMELQDDLGLNFDFDQTDNTAALGGDDTAELPAPVQDETMLDAPPLEEGLEQPEEEGDQDKEGDREGTPATVNRASAEPREEGDNTYMEQTIRSSMEREEEGIVSPEKPKPVRKRKAVHVVVDETIEIRSKQIKAQQADHTAILKEPDFLPRDPTLLTLMSLQNTGKFAASIYFPKNMHPDLVELLSPDFVKSMAAAKRKRDAEPKPITLAGDEEEEPAAKKIQLEIPEDEEIPQQHDDILRSSADRDLEADKSAEMLELPEHREASPLQHVEDISFQQDGERFLYFKDFSSNSIQTLAVMLRLLHKALVHANTLLFLFHLRLCPSKQFMLCIVSVRNSIQLEKTPRTPSTLSLSALPRPPHAWKPQKCFSRF